eukprot:jgi/Ulvmu1/1590/UM111_0018.1
MEYIAPVRLADFDPRRHFQPNGIHSHYLFEGSEQWSTVPEPRLPCEEDASGLAIPDPASIPGYVQWQQGQAGPRTQLQTYADNVQQLTLAVHPLNAADCAPPTVAEVDYLEKRRAVRLKIAQKPPPKYEIPLEAVLTRVKRTALALVAVWQLRRLQVAPVQAALPVMTGVALGIVSSAYVRHWRRRRLRALMGLNTSMEEWINCLRELIKRQRKDSPFLNWASLGRGTESCEAINTVIRKLWRYLDPHASAFIVNRLNIILRNYDSPIFHRLMFESLKLGARAPEIVTMRTFSVTPRSIVLHAQIRLVGDDLYGSLLGTVSTGQFRAGMRNMRLSALARVELTDPMEQLPYFKAITLSFLEPLEPAFTIKLDIGLIADSAGLAAGQAVKPALMSILSNEVFSRLFVWPSRLVIPMRSRQNPMIKPVLPKMQPRMKGIVAVVAKRAAGLPIEPDHKSVAAFSVDGLHWYKTRKAYQGPSPVWEDDSGSDAGSLGSHLLLIPLKELDAGLQVAIGLSDISAHYKWRDRDNAKIAARVTVQLHNLAEGEVLEGWHKLRPRESRQQDGMDLCADERLSWAPPWRKASVHDGVKRPRRLRTEFDTFQRDFCNTLRQPLPPIPRPLQSARLGSFPLPEVTKMSGPGMDALPDSDEDSEEDSWHTRRPWRTWTKARRHSHAASVAVRPARYAVLQPEHGAGSSSSVPAVGPAPSTGAKAGGGRNGRVTVPWGGIYLSLVMLEAKTLKAHFNASQRERALGLAPDDGAVAALAGVLQPWQAAAGGGEQLGCLFATVLEAHGLSLWDESSGFGPPAYTLGLPDSYDTHVRLRLVSGSGSTRVVHQQVRTGIAEHSRDPLYLREFEFLAVPLARTLEVVVVNDVNVGKGRFQDKVIGVVVVQLADLARCTDSRLWRATLDLTAPAHPWVVTGRIVLTLDWLPLTPGPTAPALPARQLLRLGRGSLFVRVICAWDLAPMDVQAMSCNARVCLLAGGAEAQTHTRDSLCPVWMHCSHFQHVSEVGALWLEVQHVTQYGPQSIARCHINVADLVCVKGRAVLVTKCLQGWDADTQHTQQRSELHWTARLGGSGSIETAPTAKRGDPHGHGPLLRSADRGVTGSSSILELFEEPSVDGPDALRWAARSSAHAHGSLKSDHAAPAGVVPSGWLMFEVAYSPYDDGAGEDAKGSTFPFPRVRRDQLAAEALRLHAVRQAKLRQSLTDTQTPLLAGSLITRKKAVVVGEVGNCLRVEVLRGERMPRTDIIGKSDPYVVLTAQSEAGLQMFRSKTCWATLNPSWNACMDVWEAHSTGGVLEVQVWDDDVLRRDDHIGTEHINISRTLLAPDPGRRNGHAREPTLAVPADMHGGGLEAPEALPAAEVLTREVTLELRGARHKRGLPAVHLRVTWVPAGQPPPWGAAREGRPLQPWRHTDLCALQALVDTADIGSTAFTGSTAGDSIAFRSPGRPGAGSPTASSAAAAHAHRGRLSLVVEAVEGGATASRFPKYVTVRLNRAHVGKTRSLLGCRYQHPLAPMANVSVDDILVFKFKARALQRVLLGQATQAVRELVPNPDREQQDVPFLLPLSGTHLALRVRFSWEPVLGYTRSGCSNRSPSGR